jgi:galacturan 1,4-alpha-galacturonidase
MHKQLIAALSLPALALANYGAPSHYYTGCIKTCVVDSSANDTSYAIEDAFRTCGHETGEDRGKVIFKKNETYNVRRVMNTTGLTNVDVEIHGTLLWDINIDYWLNNSLPIGFQNQSTAWIFGGENVHWNGFGYGTLDGNGQVWYDFIDGGIWIWWKAGLTTVTPISVQFPYTSVCSEGFIEVQSSIRYSFNIPLSSIPSS